ncbi:MAG: HEAT repeat domain-containing protein [Elusimicrobia bacterium]|nr:HEAT repeat domain-containing protein [Elusimicrobiota bacterium]
MKNMNKMSLLILLFAVPGLLQAQAPSKETSGKPAVKKTAPAAKKKTAKPAAEKAKPAAEKAKPAAEQTKPAAEQTKPVSPQAKQEAPVSPFDSAMAGLKSKDAAERRQAAEKLGQLRDQKAVPALIKAISDQSPLVRQSAVDSLGLMTSREAAPVLADVLIKDADPAVRQQAAISLSYIMDQNTGPALVKALKDPAQPVRYAALHTLGVIHYAPAEKDMIGMLASEDQSMRRGAIASLGQMQSKSAGEPIAAQLGDPDQYVKIEAIKAVGNIGYAPAAPQLVKLLDKSEQPPVRVEAALALSKMGMPDGLMTAYEFIRSPELSMRSQSMNIIAAVGDARSLQFVQELYNTETDPSNKSMLDFTVQRLKARLSQK